MKYQGGIFFTCFLLAVGQLDYCSADLPKFFLGGDDPAKNFRLTIEGPAGQASFVANGRDDSPSIKDLGDGGLNKAERENYNEKFTEKIFDGAADNGDPNKVVLLARSAGSDSGLDKILENKEEKVEKTELKKETGSSEETGGRRTTYRHKRRTGGSSYHPKRGGHGAYKRVLQKDRSDLDLEKSNNDGPQFKLTIERDGGSHRNLEDYEEEEEEIIEEEEGDDEKYYGREESRRNSGRGRGRGKWKVGITGHDGRGRGRGKKIVSNSWYGENNGRGPCPCGCPNCNNGPCYAGSQGGPYDNYDDYYESYYF